MDQEQHGEAVSGQQQIQRPKPRPRPKAEQDTRTPSGKPMPF